VARNELFPEFRLPDELLRRPFDLVVLGNSRLEMIVRVPDWSLVGAQDEVRVDKLTYAAGGCGANVACFAARLGGRVSLVSRLGDGRHSEEVWEELRRSGVDSKYVRRSTNAEGSLLIIFTNPEGDWTVMSCIDPALEVQPEDLPERRILERAKFLHIDGFCLARDHRGAGLETVVERARQAGCLVSVDGATPVATSRPDLLSKFFAMSDIVFANRSEALAASKTATLEEAATAFRSLGPQVSFLKIGKAGSWVVTREGVGRVPAYEVQVVDTVAAGDAYTAATLVHLSQGGALSEAARRGSAAGALACRGAGSLSKPFEADELNAMVGRIQVD
jgi:sugar/nucleoside kinase (ribokinase family)